MLRVIGRSCAHSVLVVVGVGLCACGGPTPGRSVTQHDSAGVRLVDIGAGALDTLVAWDVALTPALEVGGADETESTRLFMVAGAQVLASGDLAIANDGTKQIRVFDRAGRFVRAWGRSGQGPGEYQNVRLLPASAHDRLVTYDALQQRVIVLDSAGRVAAQLSLGAMGMAAIRPVSWRADSSILVQNRLRMPAPAAKGTVREVETVLLMSGQGDTIATFGQFAADERVLRARPGGGLTGGDAPFQRRLLVAPADSVVYIASTGPWEVLSYGLDGKLRRALRIDLPAHSVTPEMIAAYRATVMQFAVDPRSTEEWTMLSADDVFPAHLPAFDQMLVDRKGLLWIRRTPIPVAELACWYIFDQRGMPVAKASVTSGLRVTDITANHIVGIVKDELGREAVRMYEVQRVD